MTTRAHVVVAVVAVVLLLLIVRLVGRRQLRSKYALLWLALGVVLVPLAAFPRTLEVVSDRLGIAYAPTTFLLASLGFLLVVVIHLTWEVSRLEQRLRTVAEELALLAARADDRRVGPVDAEPDEPDRDP